VINIEKNNRLEKQKKITAEKIDHKRKKLITKEKKCVVKGKGKPLELYTFTRRLFTQNYVSTPHHLL
jgi:hypothetical protein